MDTCRAVVKASGQPMRRATFVLLAALLLPACSKSNSTRTADPAATSAPSTAPVAEEAASTPAEPSASAQASEAAETAAAVPDSTEPAPIAAYPPHDDCAARPGWTAFRAKLEAAIAAHDDTALTALAAPDVKLDFGGGSGSGELRKRLNDPDRQLWQKLSEIMPLGCGFQGGIAAMPWIFWNVPDSVDPYQGMLVTGADVPLRKAASPSAPLTASLDWALVEAAPHTVVNPRFLKVTVAGTKLTGFIEARSMRSLLDYRIIAEPAGTDWHITAFIAGD
jgi:hypothetical protein